MDTDFCVVHLAVNEENITFTFFNGSIKLHLTNGTNWFGEITRGRLAVWQLQTTRLSAESICCHTGAVSIICSTTSLWVTFACVVVEPSTVEKS